MTELAPELAYWADDHRIPRERFYALACDPARSIVVEACAGAGKTWMLVSRILRALLAGAEPQQIVAITFTRKAAGEMRQRLAEWLAEFAQAPEAEQLAALRHAEALLLVDHGQVEAPEAHVPREQRVGADRELRRAAGERIERLAPPRRRQRAGHENGREPRALEHGSQTVEVLLREQLRGRHEHRLASTFGGQEHREQGDDGLTRPDVPLQETVHPPVGTHVRVDLAEDSGLCSCQLEG